jgi:hypothetical protein
MGSSPRKRAIKRDVAAWSAASSAEIAEREDRAGLGAAFSSEEQSRRRTLAYCTRGDTFRGAPDPSWSRQRREIRKGSIMQNQDTTESPVARTLSVIGSSWTCLILRDSIR